MTTAANTPQTRNCGHCGGVQRIRVELLKDRNRLRHRYLVMGLVTIPGTLVMIWYCDTCSAWEDAKTRWVEIPDKPPVRPEIVNAIRRLRNAGHKFFDWEKRR